MGKVKKTPPQVLEVNNFVRVKVGCRGYHFHKNELGRVTRVFKGVSRPIEVDFYGVKERYQLGDLERI
ncbi:MAG: hypothetical protein KJ888_20180 [Gammaproteobacteria bacterium]|nr:hypothetical protein [Gammaproteobacteria bacterium]